MRLYTAKGVLVREGDRLPDFRGEFHTVRGWTEPPPGSPSTGRVHTDRGSFYPGVLDLHWGPHK